MYDIVIKGSMNQCNTLLFMNNKCYLSLAGLIRDYPQGEEEFVKADGFSSLMRAMQSGEEKMVVKSSFLLNSLIRETEAHKGKPLFLFLE